MPDQPQAKTVPFTFEHLGRTFSDPYTWLQDKDDPEVIAYLEAENAYKDELLKHTDELQETLFQEMRGRMAEDDKGVPERRGEYYYYWRIAEGQPAVHPHTSVPSPLLEPLVEQSSLLLEPQSRHSHIRPLSTRLHIHQ